MCASRRMNGTSGASWFSRRYEASSGDGAEPVIGPRYARTRWRLLTMRGAPGPKLSIALQHEVLRFDRHYPGEVANAVSPFSS